MVAITAIPLIEQQHLVLDGADWSFYEDLLTKFADRALRVTFHNGEIEIMAPLSQHELFRRAIGSLIDCLATELNISMQCYGSTTFRREDRQVGLEPDDCYYIANESKVRGMMDFNPAIHPAPDLAIEIDITSRSIPRQPVYAELGVREIWRFDGKRLHVLILDDRGNYSAATASVAFPFLPMNKFEAFVNAMQLRERISVLREFRDWVKTLPIA